MGTYIALLAYMSYTAFWWRFISHALLWCRMSTPFKGLSAPVQKITTETLSAATMDILFFRRLFQTNKPLWIGSWTFHASFFLVLIRHLKYFFNPVPDWIGCMQPLGIFAGYVLPLSLFYTLMIRITAVRQRYVSYHNYLLLSVLFLISISGLLMRTVFRTDLLAVKGFITGILTFSPDPLPNSIMFAMHFLVFLILVPFLPFHIFTVPFVTLEARKRDEGLRTVMHDK